MALTLAAPLPLSADTRHTAGMILLTIVAIEWGGWYLLQIVRGKVARTEFQERFERAGHAHAGVLVTLAMLTLVLADSADLTGPVSTLARNGVAFAAILMPAGFFFSAIGRDRTEPNRWVVLIYLGMVSLTLGVVALGLSLLLS
ncbi:MAG TPA: hypothetical protein VHJ83_05390 [Micromonosporaceae bacterium]|jgi:hypothetical protein|nr:hypothetical protein [Micromonosporaceae bacterium]